MANRRELLVFENIYKHYPGVTALKGVSFSLNQGEIVALLGENGAGKSTLVKILCGVIPYGEYEGSIYCGGTELKCSGTKDAADRGIAMIPQEICIQPDLTVAENIMLGNWPQKGVFIDVPKMNELAEKAMKKLDLDIDVTQKARQVTSGIHQMMAIARALMFEPSVLILDEPTSALTSKETEALLEKLIDLRSEGICSLYITHKLDEVFKIADRSIVFRDGSLISQYGKAEMDQAQIIQDIVGEKKEREYVHECHMSEEVRLSFRNFSVDHAYVSGKRILDNVSFDLHKGEILGIAGLLGSGRSELLRAAFGAMPKLSGELWMDGEEIVVNDPAGAIDHGIGLLTEARGLDGYVKTMSVGENMSLVILKKLQEGLFLNRKKERILIDKFFRYIHIKAPSASTPILSLSGGNQQKVLVAKWLMNDSKVLFLDEPTRGVDVGAREEIYNLMSDLTKNGASIIIVSSELPELVKVCDRFVILSGGTVSEVVDAGKSPVSEAELLAKINGTAMEK